MASTAVAPPIKAGVHSLPKSNNNRDRADTISQSVNTVPPRTEQTLRSRDYAEVKYPDLTAAPSESFLNADGSTTKVPDEIEEMDMEITDADRAERAPFLEQGAQNQAEADFTPPSEVVNAYRTAYQICRDTWWRYDTKPSPNDVEQANKLVQTGIDI